MEKGGFVKASELIKELKEILDNNGDLAVRGFHGDDFEKVTVEVDGDGEYIELI